MMEPKDVVALVLKKLETEQDCTCLAACNHTCVCGAMWPEDYINEVIFLLKNLHKDLVAASDDGK